MYNAVLNSNMKDIIRIYVKENIATIPTITSIH